MADITRYITAIRTARYGEEVRGSIADALTAVNGQVESDTESAGQYASNASGSATAASNSASAAAQIADSLAEDLQELHDTETAIETAEANRVAAEQARVTAEESRADAASGYVNQAAEYANQARQHASSDNAQLSQSWAVGGTGTRYGEDTNNSKYWAEVAAQVATTGGVASFNGRTGNVEPASGDYSSSLIRRGSGTVETALSAIEQELGNIDTSDTKLNTVTFTSNDETDTSQISSWTSVDKLRSNETHATLFSKISTMFKNIRYLMKILGNESMGTTASTITGAIAEHESDISTLNSNIAYKQGDAISFSGLKVFGRTVNAGDRVYMCINLPKPVSANGFSLTITAANAFVVSGSFGVGALTDIQHKGLQGPCGQVTFSLPLASSTTGGTPCCLEITGQLVFS